MVSNFLCHPAHWGQINNKLLWWLGAWAHCPYVTPLQYLKWGEYIVEFSIFRRTWMERTGDGYWQSSANGLNRDTLLSVFLVPIIIFLSIASFTFPIIFFDSNSITLVWNSHMKYVFAVHSYIFLIIPASLETPTGWNPWSDFPV